MNQEKMLRYYLLVFGSINIFVISFTIPIFFGDIILWHPRNIPTEMMMSVIYLAMGIVMVLAARQPKSHKSLVDFLILANTLHAMVMLIYARNMVHIVVDVIGIGAMGVLPVFFYPWGLRMFLRYVKE